MKAFTAIHVDFHGPTEALAILSKYDPTHTLNQMLSCGFIEGADNWNAKRLCGLTHDLSPAAGRRRGALLGA
jgi:hypothetical protein